MNHHQDIISIVVSSLGRGQFTASLDSPSPEGGEVIFHRSTEPFFTAARTLMAKGTYSPDATLMMRHAGDACVSLTQRLGSAAKLTVQEGRNGGPVVVAYRPRPVNSTGLEVEPLHDRVDAEALDA